MKVLQSFTIRGDPKTKKNSMQIIRLKNRYSMVQSKTYKDYENEFLYQVLNLGIGNMKYSQPLEISCRYYRKTKRRVDLTNLLGCTDDCLVKSGIIEDDNCNILVSHDGSRVFHDKENPRVEIEIREFENVDLWKIIQDQEKEIERLKKLLEKTNEL